MRGGSVMRTKRLIVQVRRERKQGRAKLAEERGAGPAGVAGPGVAVDLQIGLLGGECPRLARVRIRTAAGREVAVDERVGLVSGLLDLVAGHLVVALRRVEPAVEHDAEQAVDV